MWIVFAFGSALFAGLMSILAKCGIRETDSAVATAIRTLVVLGMSWVMVFVSGKQSGLRHIPRAAARSVSSQTAPTKVLQTPPRNNRSCPFSRRRSNAQNRRLGAHQRNADDGPARAARLPAAPFSSMIAQPPRRAQGVLALSRRKNARAAALYKKIPHIHGQFGKHFV